MRILRARAILVMLLVFSNLMSVGAISIDVNIQEDQINNDAPFSISVDPDNLTVRTGEYFNITISIVAVEGFNSTVNLVLDVPFVGHNMSLHMFPLMPSFPRMQEASIQVPLKARAGVAKGILRASSGKYMVTKSVQVNLIGENTSSKEEVMSELWQQEQELHEEEARSKKSIINRIKELIKAIHEMTSDILRAIQKILP
jgi:hypothetical protein